MKNNNKLTLKTLQQELENLKANKSIKSPTPAKAKNDNHASNTAIGHDIKESFINKLYMKSSMFYLWLFTGVLGYARKIPIIGRLITLASLWYGRTTWWKILVKIRKLFIIFNAIIGMFIVFKTTGYNHETFLAGFSAMGHTYIEIFTNFTKRLFTWLLDIFGYNIEPKYPKIKPISALAQWQGPRWSPRGIESSWNNRLHDISKINKELFKNPFNINLDPTPSYNISSWLWWSIKVVGVLGVCFISYKFILDPLFIHDYLNSGKGKAIDLNNSGPEEPGVIFSGENTPDIGIGSSVKKVMALLVVGPYKLYSSIKNTLNPFNWIAAAGFSTELEEQNRNFLSRQFELTNAQDQRFYPFTNINPYKPWYTRIRILLLGETMNEMEVRLRDRDFALRDYLAIQVTDVRTLGSQTPATRMSDYITEVRG